MLLETPPFIRTNVALGRAPRKMSSTGRTVKAFRKRYAIVIGM